MGIVIAIEPSCGSLFLQYPPVRILALTLLLVGGVPANAVERPPVVIRQVSPIYPPWLLGPEITEGEVIVAFVVTPEGKTTEVTSVRAMHPLLGRAAVAAVKQWTFRPGLRDGVAVNCRMQVPIVFSIEGFLGNRYLSGHFTCLNSSDGAELPTLVATVSPDYPGKYWRKNIDGAVVAEFAVTAEGKTTDIKIVSSSHPEFADSVAKAIPGFRFAIDPSYVGSPRVRLDLQFVSAATHAKNTPPARQKNP